MDTLDTGSETDVAGKIAIIGMAGRFPGASSTEEFWKLVCEGREAITFFARDELDPDIDPSEIEDPHYVAARGIIPDADCFDAQFFGISPREAQILDPQCRILLELAWATLEDAGYRPSDYDGLIGVFAGSGFNSYLLDHVMGRRDLVATYGRHLVELANAPDYLATRISYKLGLRGPSVSLFTGCSTSLVAVCHAVDSLLNHQSDMVLAGGAFLATPLRSGYLYHEGEMSSPDGHTRPFDENARGTVFCSGAGLILLKRLQDAQRDGDHIYAVIRGTGINNDGAEKVSFTAPSVSGQASAIALAHAMAGITPDMIGYVETHGTGTPLGDPIEIQALTQAFESRTRSGQYCAIGSVKGNIGHLDAAAGIAGLIKTALALRSRKLPPSINFQAANPAIDFSSSPFFVNTQLTDWPAWRGTRIAGVSSFGVGGTNAHVVLEEPPALDGDPPGDANKAWHLLPLAAKTSSRLDELIERVAEHLSAHPQLALRDVMYTLQKGREHFAHRCVVACRTLSEATEALRSRRPSHFAAAKSPPKANPVVFMFSGQGSQYAGMCRGLYEDIPEFRAEIDRCAEKFAPLVGADLRDMLTPPDGDLARANSLLNETRITQPALFMVEYALARLWRSFGVMPDVCLGHSIGEYVAACLGEVMSLDDAARLVALRGQLMFSCEPGAMLSVFLSEQDLKPLLPSDLNIAAVNAPNACVVSGPEPAIGAFQKSLASRDVGYRMLHTSHAFHSSMMDPILEEFTREVSKVRLSAPKIPFLSNVTGTWATPELVTNPSYWGEHLRQPVRFSSCVKTLIDKRPHTFIEVGPGTALRSIASMHAPADSEGIFMASCRSPRDQVDDTAILYRTLGALWTQGQQIHWPNGGNVAGRRVPLVGYPFERSRHWINRARHELNAGPAPSAQERRAPEDSRTTEEGLSTSNTVSKVIDAWRAALGHNRISPDDDFFELGGDSLIASNVVAKLRLAHGVDIGPTDIYSARTAGQFAALIEEKHRHSTGSNTATTAPKLHDISKLIG